MNILIPTEYFRSPYASIIPGLIYSIGAMGGGYSDVLNMNGSYGNCFFRSPYTYNDHDAWQVYPSGDVYNYVSNFVYDSYGYILIHMRVFFLLT